MTITGIVRLEVTRETTHKQFFDALDCELDMLMQDLKAEVLKAYLDPSFTTGDVQGTRFSISTERA